MRIHHVLSAAFIGGILGITALAAPAAADDWNSGPGPRAVSVTDLERPECNNLSRGASGWCTTALQTTLNQVGYRIAIDGKFGPATQAQVQLFQQEHNAEDDGIVGPETRFRLRGAVTNAEAKERVDNHDMGYIPDTVCSLPGWLGVLSFACEDFVDPDPAY
ncbi:peptidoglycan-binding domain-containing protein [Streptomyces sp. 1222.5]|uniref:peptidoglycan-binding domain-containing protein n=1 Tax=Streptomyces sp. 1222.5 TaxID=1881026 RepID=UPI003EB71736